MKLKRNSLTMILVVSFLFMALSGCVQQAEPDSAQPPLETVTYSNLTDADSRKLLTEALADANVDETRTKLLLDRVDQFNASVKSEWLTGGFENAAPTETRYDPYEMQDLWTEKNGSFPGYNCRVTAFSLFGEFVTAGVDQPETQGEDSLFMDLETLAADPAVLCGDSTSKFCALFAPVTAADTTEVADQVKALQAGWSERGISFEDSSARLISVVLHDRFSDTDNTLFIGHVGVLLPAEDGSLYFIEKVAFQEPYRLVKIQNRTELSDYLMEKYKDLVRRKARLMYLPGADQEDLIQEGMIGLFKAVRDYEKDRDASFSTFADLCISRQIYTAVEAGARKKHAPLNHYVSLSQPEDRDEDKQAYEPEDVWEKSPEELVIDQENTRLLEETIEQELTPLEKQVMDLHLTGMGYREIAKVLGRDGKSTDNALQRSRGKLRRALDKKTEQEKEVLRPSKGEE